MKSVARDQSVQFKVARCHWNLGAVFKICFCFYLPCLNIIFLQVKKPFIFTAVLFSLVVILPYISVINWALFRAIVVNFINIK